MEKNTNSTALLVMDVQSSILQNISDKAQLVNNLSKAIEHARNNKITVIYVVVGFRKGAPEVNMNNKGFAAAKSRFANADAEEFLKIEPALAPTGDEVTVIKRRISAFSGSDLEVILRAFGIQHMILTGIATSGVVLSTLREAADKDYRLTVLSDGCADPDEEVHRVLTTKVFPRQAEVITVDDWVKI